MKFRKRPVVVDAEQWLGPESKIDGVCMQEHKLTSGPDEVPQVAHVHTLEGLHFVTPGDWIITGVAGEKYACKPDIFEATYEHVPDPKPYETPADD